jgi:Tol biopolymer transport system component
MGTPEYSSPEQLEGKPLDPRSDIFSFGATVYEMITGTRAFQGESTAQLISVILRDDPRPVREIVANVPESLERTLARCLSKDADDRWQTANDLLFELRSIVPASSSVSPRAPLRARFRLSIERVLWITALSILAAALLWNDRSASRRGTQAVTPPDIRFNIHPASGARFHAGYDVPFALSPDGRRLVYVGVASNGTRQLWLQSLSSETEKAEAMQGTEGASSPFWSPDNQWIGFFAGRSLKKIRLSARIVQPVADKVWTVGGAAWSRDDVIIFPAAPGGLFRVSAQGGPVSQVTQGEASHFWPQFLSGGKRFLYVATAGSGEIRLGSLDGEPSRSLMKFPVRMSAIAYVPGYLFFVQDENLFARPFDEQRLVFSGEPVRLLGPLPVESPGRAPFSVSAAGLLAYWTYAGGTPGVLRWFDRDGHASPAVEIPAKYTGFALSHDGHRVVVSRRSADGGADLWVRNLDGGGEKQLTFDKAAFTPQWSPDGSSIAFSSTHPGPPPKLFVKSLAETNTTDTLVGAWPMRNYASSWSSDGNSIISVRMDRINGDDLWLQRIRGGGEQRLSINTESNEVDGKLSPGDQWLAYVTDQSGKDEVWVASFPDGKIRRQVSTGGGTSPQWGPRSREIFYVSLDNRVIVRTVSFGEGSLELGTPHTLFSVGDLIETDRRLMPTSNSFAATSDGRRFLVAVLARQVNIPPIRILVNWRALLAR